MTIARDRLLYYSAAAATAIAGMLHLMLGPNNLGMNVNQGILFIVGGIAQVFWIIPMIRRWGRVWYGVGIAGTAVLMALFLITRFPGNPINGRGGGANSIAIAVEISQAIFIGLAAAIILYERRKKKKQIAAAGGSASGGEQQPAKKSDGRKVPILAGVVVALILAGVFVLPMAMPRPMGGGPPGATGGPTAGQTPGQPVTPVDTTTPTPTSSTNQTCTITPSLIEVEGTTTPQQTEGPYFVDGIPNRSDITSDSSSGTVEEGLPLSLVINVYDDEGNGNCMRLEGAQVDVWHANSQGSYSGVSDAGTLGEDFLRGYQLADDNGTARFSTVYPGWYEGRAIHIHVKVRTFNGSQQEAFDWTSQLYLPNAANDQVHTLAPYSNHGPVNMMNEQDGIYRGGSTDVLVQSNSGQHLMLNLTEQDEGGGYSGTFNVVVDVDVA